MGCGGLKIQNRVRAMSQGMAEIEERRGNARVSVEKRGNKAKRALSRVFSRVDTPQWMGMGGAVWMA